MFTVNRSMLWVRVATASSLALVAAGLLETSLEAADFAGLAARARADAATSHGISQNAVEAAASRLRTAIAEARRHEAAGDAIDWTALESQAANAPTADAAVLRRIGDSVRSQSKGFEPPVHPALASAIERYARLVEASKPPAGESPTRKLLERLTELLDDAAKSGASEGGDFGGLEAAGPLLESLEDLGFGSGVVSEVRRAVGRPNVFIDAKESLLSEAVNRPVDEVAPVDEVILGIRQRGTGHTQGFVRLDLVPSEDRAVMDLVLAATNHSNTRGGRGPVTVCSRGTTDLGARRRILLEEERAYGLAPEARASAHSQTEGIGVRAHLGRNIIRNVASRRAADMRPEADAIVAGRARERLLHRFDDQTREGVDGVSSNYQTRFREPLMIQGLYPEMLHHNTTDAALHSVARKMLGGQVGAASSPPPPADRAVLSARFHQTAITNAASVWLAGRTITKQEVEEEYARRGWTLPDALAKGIGEKGTEDAEDARPWSVRFVPEKPVALDVDDDRVTCTFRAADFTSENERGEPTATGPLDVTVTYRIEHDAQGVRLKRQDKIAIKSPVENPDEEQGYSLRKGVVTRRLGRRLDRVMAETIELKPLALPGQLESAGPLPIERLSSRKDGWITAGWREKGTTFLDATPAGEPVPAVPSESQEVIGPGVEKSASR